VTSREDDVQHLKKNVLTLSAELIAMDVLLRALIASHPKPGDLKAAIEGLRVGITDAARDVGFDTNRPQKAAEAAAHEIQKHIDRWLGILVNVPATDLRSTRK